MLLTKKQLSIQLPLNYVKFLFSGIAAVVRVDIENALKDDEWLSTDFMLFLKEKYENEKSIQKEWCFSWNFNSCVDFFTSNSCVDFWLFLAKVPLAAYATIMEWKFTLICLHYDYYTWYIYSDAVIFGETSEKI